MDSEESERILSSQRSLKLKLDAPRICAVTISFCSGGRCCHRIFQKGCAKSINQSIKFISRSTCTKMNKKSSLQ